MTNDATIYQDVVRDTRRTDRMTVDVNVLLVVVSSNPSSAQYFVIHSFLFQQSTCGSRCVGLSKRTRIVVISENYRKRYIYGNERLVREKNVRDMRRRGDLERDMSVNRPYGVSTESTRTSTCRSEFRLFSTSYERSTRRSATPFSTHVVSRCS